MEEKVKTMYKQEILELFKDFGGCSEGGEAWEEMVEEINRIVENIVRDFKKVDNQE